MEKLKLALQIYTVREDAEKDFCGTLQKIAAMGYDGVEFAGLYGHTAEQVRDWVKETGLVPLSAHVPYRELTGDLEGSLDCYQSIGCAYIAVPYVTEEYHPAAGRFHEVADRVRHIGEACRQRGLTLLYHNHDFEFELMPDGRRGLDYLYETVGPGLLQTEIDVCWAKVAGLDPVVYIRRYAGRCPLVHLKDYAGEKSGGMYELIGLEGEKTGAPKAFAFRAVGYGVQDIPAIVTASRESGARWLVVEQDSHSEHSALEDARLSIGYLRSL